MTTESFIVRVDKWVAEGRGLARDERFVYFVEGAYPRELVRIEVTRRKRRFAYARAVEVLEPSSARVAAECPMFGRCGGCRIQDLDYGAQLEAKQAMLADAFFRLPQAIERMQPIWGHDPPWYYRNKMDMTFGCDEYGLPVLGMHRRRSFTDVVSASPCRLQSGASAELVAATEAWARREALPPYDQQRHEGLLRQLWVREGKATGERLVMLVAARDDPKLDGFVEIAAPFATAVTLEFNDSLSGAPPASERRVLAGTPQLTERLGGFSFRIDPYAFFQTNTVQAERMFALIEHWARERTVRRALDLYAGMGVISMHLARAGAAVNGVEVDQAAVSAGQLALQENGVDGVDLIAAPAEQWTRAACEDAELVVVDPPRAGLHRRVSKWLLRALPQHLFYVSCNPSTLARDLEYLVDGGYEVECVQPVDMFPHTHHLETVVRLQRASL